MYRIESDQFRFQGDACGQNCGPASLSATFYPGKMKAMIKTSLAPEVASPAMNHPEIWHIFSKFVQPA